MNDTRLAIPNKAITGAPMLVQSLGDAVQLGAMMHESGLFPDIRSAQQATIIILAGIELGLPPFQALRGLYIQPRSGKVEMHASTMAMLIQCSPHYSYEIVELSDTRCTIDLVKNGKYALRHTVTIEDADRAELTTYYDTKTGQMKPSPSWKRFPRNLLFARCISNVFRFGCPELSLGVYTVGETSDTPGLDAEVDDVLDGTGQVIAPAQAPGPLQDPELRAKTREYLERHWASSQVIDAYLDWWEASPSIATPDDLRKATMALASRCKAWVLQLKSQVESLGIEYARAKELLGVESMLELMQAVDVEAGKLSPIEPIVERVKAALDQDASEAVEAPSGPPERRNGEA